MALQYSVFLRNSILDAYGVNASLGQQFKISLFTGDPPATPEAAATGTHLVTFEAGGSNLTFDAPVDGVMNKAAAEIWSGTANATGTAGYFRMWSTSGMFTGETGQIEDTSEEFPRIQGTVKEIGETGGDMYIPDTDIVDTQAYTLDVFRLTAGVCG